jgi:hypothetical protein
MTALQYNLNSIQIQFLKKETTNEKFTQIFLVNMIFLEKKVRKETKLKKNTFSCKRIGLILR